MKPVHHIICFKFHSGMNIFVHGNGHAGMSEDLRQTFNIETKLHATSRKGVEPRRRSKKNTLMLKFFIVMVLGSAVLIFLSFFNTYREMNSYPVIDFDSVEEYADTTCKVEITGTPDKNETREN